MIVVSDCTVALHKLNQCCDVFVRVESAFPFSMEDSELLGMVDECLLRGATVLLGLVPKTLAILSCPDCPVI